MEILRQEDQWPDRVAANRTAYDGKGKTEEELAPHKHVVNRPDIKVMKGEDTGLYGEDEDHPYDVIARPSGHGNSYDVLKPLG